MRVRYRLSSLTLRGYNVKVAPWWVRLWTSALFYRPSWMLVHVLPQHHPVLATMDRPHSICRMLPLPIQQPRVIDLQRRIGVAQHRLPHIAQTVLDVVRKPGAVRHEADTEDVETVQLVHK